MLVQGTKFVVVKKGSREVGMLGEKRLREALNPNQFDESKESSGYFDSI